MSLPSLTLHFLRPWWWLALLPLPLILLALARTGDGRAALTRLADAVLLPHLLRGEGSRRRLALTIAAMAWLLAVAALSGPAWRQLPVPLYANGAARVVALSLSNDMLAQDLKPDRLTRARYAVRDLLAAARDARTALIAYAGDAFVVAPLTDDRQTVLNLLDALSPDVMPVAGDDAARAIGQAVALLQQAHIDGGEIVLVTDTADAAAIGAARKARAAGVRVDVLGVGSARGAPVPNPDGGFQRDAAGGLRIARRDDAALTALANAGGGRYAPLGADGSGVAELGPPASVQGSVASRQVPLWQDGGAWLLIPLLPLVALAFRRGWLCMLALMLVTPFARASTWDALWATPDQRAAQALGAGDNAAAQKLAHDPSLRGAAAYRSGDYTAAVKHFGSASGAQAKYDLGNALAKAGRYRQAIAAYDHALKLDPGLADARANRDAVLAWLKQHPPQNPPQGGGGAQGHSSPKSGEDGSSPASSNGQQPGSGKSAQDKSDDEQKNGGQAGRNGANSSDLQNADSAAGKRARGSKGAGDSGASPAEDAQQRAQVERARQALAQQRARQEAQQQARQAGGKSRRPGNPGAYALGADQDTDKGRFDPQQRALLNAVPDDPGALLRRKFMLEWQQRNGQAAEDGQ